MARSNDNVKSQYQRHWTQRIPLWLLRVLINLWPPYLGTGISVNKISNDYRTIDVSMKLHWYNRNYVGTHFGGSMYAMTDPFFMLILIKNLGKNYIVWDKAASIEFKKPGTGTLHACFEFSEEEIHTIKQQADTNGKMILDKSVDLLNDDGLIIAHVVKTLYVRHRSHDAEKNA